MKNITILRELNFKANLIYLEEHEYLSKDNYLLTCIFLNKNIYAHINAKEFKKYKFVKDCSFDALVSLKYILDENLNIEILYTIKKIIGNICENINNVKVNPYIMKSTFMFEDGTYLKSSHFKV